MRILFLTGRELSYTRNEVLLRALRRFASVDVIASVTKPRSLPLNSLSIAQKAISHLRHKQYDFIFVGFYGYFILWLLRGLIRQPILFDAFVSNYDTMCFDRQVFSPNSLLGKTAFWLDQATCRLTDHILLDTVSHATYFQQTFGIATDRISALPVGCNEDIFTPHVPATRQSVTQVLHYSTFLPLHGVDIIVQAAAQLTHEPIHFHLIGTGDQHSMVKELTTRLRLTNVTFAPPLPLPVLADQITASTICLGGHFGQSAKAGRVIPGKIYQMLAMAKPIIAADTPGNHELLRHGETAYLVEPGYPTALAAAIVCLHKNHELRQRLAQQGRTLYETDCSEAIITQRLHNIAQQLIKL